jgi:hypothetical protein
MSLTPAFVAGVLPHVVERILVGDAIRDPASASTASVGAVFAEARRVGIGSRVVASDEVASLPFAPEALARLDAALADGAIAVVPERPVAIGGAERVGWWIIDPATGHTFDQMDDGRGTAAEDMTIIVPRVRDAQALRRLRQCQVLIFLAALGVLFGTMAVGAAGGASAAGASGNTTMGFALLGAGAIGGGSVFEQAAAGC